VLTANPAMTFRIGNYFYEIKRKDKQSVYSVTDGKETISLPILYAFGEGQSRPNLHPSVRGRSDESLVSFYNEIKGLDFTIGAARGIPPSLKQAVGRRLPDNEVSNCF